jgi:hypothetical protein
VRDPGDRRAVAQLAVVGDGRVPLALAAQRERLMLHHRLEPADQLLLAGAGRLGEQDLQPALAGVLGVLGRGGVAARGREDLRPMPGEQREGRRIDLGALRPDAPFAHQHDAQGDGAPLRPRRTTSVSQNARDFSRNGCH